jgi:hypothetical protein
LNQNQILDKWFQIRLPDKRYQIEAKMAPNLLVKKSFAERHLVEKVEKGTVGQPIRF